MFGVGRDLCGSSGPNPLLKQGHLQQAAEDHVQAGLEYLQRRRNHNPSGQPVNFMLSSLENDSVKNTLERQENPRRQAVLKDSSSVYSPLAELVSTATTKCKTFSYGDK